MRSKELKLFFVLCFLKADTVTTQILDPCLAYTRLPLQPYSTSWYAIPAFYSCRTASPVYMQADVADIEGIQNLVACVNTSVVCGIKVPIQVKYCNNELIVYKIERRAIEIADLCLVSEIPCIENWPTELRLVEGSNPHEGRVEVKKGDNWGTVCDDSWDHWDAEVVCRHLGFSSTGAVAKGSAYFGQGNGSIVLDEVKCVGKECYLGMCPYTTAHNCQHSEDASVICGWPRELRLVGGSGPHEGRVEVKEGDNWGTVCDDLWDNWDAEVVCRHLGFSSTGAIAKGSAYFGQGNGSTVLDEVKCVGNERYLGLCPYTTVHNCQHGEDASVICGWPSELRLVGGSGPHEGRVEVKEGDNWGTICDDSWDNRDAEVVCRHLGFSSTGAVAKGSAYFGQGNGAIVLDEVKCVGTERYLRLCPYRTAHNCQHREDASVICGSG